MRETRRTCLQGTSTAAVGVALAGCSGILCGNDSRSSGEDGQSTAEETDTENTGDRQTRQAGATDTAVASEWSAIRTRLRDPVTPGRGEESETAREGWENGEGVLHRSGQVYVHTFETTGTHEYPCVPREAAGTVGSVTVE